MAIPIKSGADNSVLTIDGANNAARVGLYDPSGQPLATRNGVAKNATLYGVPVMGFNDSNMRAMRVDRTGAQAIAFHTLLFNEPFESTTINTNRWIAPVAAVTWVPAAAIGSLRLNNGNSVAANGTATYYTAKRFNKIGRSLLHAKARAKVNVSTNTTLELGFGDGSNLVAPSNGAFWRFTNGTVVPILATNGVMVTGDDVATALDLVNKSYTYDVWVDDESVEFTIEDVSTGLIIAEQRLNIAVVQQRIWAASHLPFMLRGAIVGGVAAAAPDVILYDLTVAMVDANAGKTAPQLAAQNANNSMLHPLTGVQTSQFANSAAPANATLSNTAAGYATLGGLFSFTAVAGGNTDYCLFGFQIPTGYQFVCTGIHIDTWNDGAAVATAPTVLYWGVSVNGDTVSLAHANSRHDLVGSQIFAVGAGIGAQAPVISERFVTPYVCESGKFFDVVMRVASGTATGSEVFRGMVCVQGYFE